MKSTLTRTGSRLRASAALAAVIGGALLAGTVHAAPAQAVVNGSITTKGQYPFFTAVPSGCGGSLVAPNWVITAAHCTTLAVGSDKVGVNTYDYSDTSTPINSTVRQIVTPNIPGLELAPDVALIRIDPVTSVKPLPLADPVNIGQTLTNVGMGAGSDGKLRSAAFTAAIRNTTGSLTTLTTVRAGTYNAPGDSGSPFLVGTPTGPRLAGVASTANQSLTRIVDVASTPALRQWFAATTGVAVDRMDPDVTLRSSGAYVSARINVADAPVNAMAQPIAGSWEQFQLAHNADYTVSLRSKANGKYLSASPDGGPLTANRDRADAWEKFVLTESAGVFTLTAASNGKSLRITPDATAWVRADANTGNATKFVLTKL